MAPATQVLSRFACGRSGGPSSKPIFVLDVGGSSQVCGAAYVSSIRLGVSTEGTDGFTFEGAKKIVSSLFNGAKNLGITDRD